MGGCQSLDDISIYGLEPIENLKDYYVMIDEQIFMTKMNNIYDNPYTYISFMDEKKLFIYSDKLPIDITKYNYVNMLCKLENDEYVIHQLYHIKTKRLFILKY